jgi:hypothetical protein
MADNFDVSTGCRAKIDDLLKEYTIYIDTGHNARNNEVARTRFINELFRHLAGFRTAKTKFDLELSQSYVKPTYDNGENIEKLFRGIADAICKNQVVGFRHLIKGKRQVINNFWRHERHSLSWQYMNYNMNIFTVIVPTHEGRSELYEFYMTITDTSKIQDDRGESGNDTDDDHDLSKIVLSLQILQSLHDRVSRLEASYGLPTASPQRLE